MSEHVPPPRPKRKAAHGYPQKAPKNGLYGTIDIGCIFFWVLVHELQLLLYPKLLDRLNLHPPCLTQVICTDKIHHRCFEIRLLLQLYLPGITIPCHPSLYLNWPKLLIFPALLLPLIFLALKSGNIITYESCMFSDDAALAGPCIVHNSCYSSSNKITSGTWLFSETIDGGGHRKKSRG